MIKTQKGMTIIELMVTMAILSVIILGLVVFFSGGVRAWITGQYQLEAQRNARQAMESMVREIRHGEIIKKDGSTATSIIFNTPFNGSPDIRYHLNTGTGILYRNTTNPIIDDVLSLSFTYLDSTDNVIPNSDLEFSNKVSKIHIELQVDVDGDSNPDITLNSDIDLRNFDL